MSTPYLTVFMVIPLLKTSNVKESTSTTLCLLECGLLKLPCSLNKRKKKEYYAGSENQTPHYLLRNALAELCKVKIICFMFAGVPLISL